MSPAPSWFDAWASDVRARGGTVQRAPKGVLALPWWIVFGDVDAEGSLAAHYPNGTWELAPFDVLLADTADRIADWFLDPATTYTFGEGMQDGQTMIGKVPDVISSAVTGAAGAIGRAVPWWAYLAFGVVAYGALVQAGVVPPLNKVLK